MNDSDLLKFVSDGFEKAKIGDAINVYNTISPFHDNDTLSLKSHYAFGWIIYYALHQSPDNEIESRKKMLARYLKLKVQVPHKLHSMILTQAMRLYKNAKDAAFNKKEEEIVRFSIVNFLKLWNLENLRPGDWKRKEHDGKQLSSTTEKMITLCVDELEDTHTLPSQELLTVIDKAVIDYSDSYNIMSQRASLYILVKEMDKAASLLRNAILLAPGKFFLWSKLASTISVSENPHLHVALLYKALISPGPEQFKGKIRISLADALASKGAYPQALWELQRVKSLYESNGWHLSVKFNDILKKIPAGIIADNPDRIYKKIEHLADDEIYSCITPIQVVKTYHKEPIAESNKTGYGKPATAWRVTDNNGNNYWLQPHRYKLDPVLPLGTRLSIRLHNDKVVKAELQ